MLEIVKRHREKNNIEAACDEILQKSIEMWTKEEEDTIDDITFVLVFFGCDEVEI